MAYSKEQIKDAKNIIILKVSRGDSLKRVMEEDSKVPSRMKVYSWLNEHHKDYDKEFYDNYARARIERADGIFDEMIDIADDGRNDYMEKVIGGETVEVVNKEHIQRSRVRIDTRKWILSRMNPKRYGDKVQTDVTTNGKELKPVVLSLGQGQNPNEATN